MNRSGMTVLLGMILVFLVGPVRAQQSRPARSASKNTNVPAAAQGDAAGSSARFVKGSGTTNFIPLWTSGSTIGNSTLFQSGSSVGIGTTSPAATLDVNGTANFSNLVTFVSGQTFPNTATLDTNTFTGDQTINGNLTVAGTGNVSLGTTGGQLQVQPATFSGQSTVNVIGGFSGNSVGAGVAGATIAGGGQSSFINRVTSNFGSVVGGFANTAGLEATVGGGFGNTASGDVATVGGGDGNQAEATYATVPGGLHNIAGGEASLAAGNSAQAFHNAAFVWGDDSTSNAVASTGSNQFIARAAGGVTFIPRATSRPG